MNIRPYSIMIKKADKVGIIARLKLFILNALLPSDFYIGVADSKSYKRFYDRAYGKQENSNPK